MDVVQKILQYYVMPKGKIPFRDWFYSLRDIKTQAIIRERLTRLERGLFGDSKSIGGGVFELRVDVGTGYRIYFGHEGRTVILLLIGGDKKSQRHDIVYAQMFWADYLGRNKI